MDALLPAPPVTGDHDLYWTAETVVGVVYVVLGPHGIRAVMQAASEADFAEQYYTRHRRFARPFAPPPEFGRVVQAALDGLETPRFAIDLGKLSPFDREVLAWVLTIPRGEVRTYGWIGQKMGREKAAQAIGNAVGRNPVPLIIPCHRVVRSDGAMGEFLLGVDAKILLLKAEGAPAGDHFERLVRRARSDAGAGGTERADAG